MEAKMTYSSADYARLELRQFVQDGLQDALSKPLLDFDTTFDELEERFGAND
ncbi:MAG: hypothetical protein IJZ82_10555 [Lachnospiraceae bacterium]|nr:hypothetical protein [Lachnospiraceae bacterium]